MKFEKAAILGNYLSKSFAKDIFRLLINYKTISASEAASRLGLHIQTIQEFLEALSELEILSKKEVNEGKRPYFRYELAHSKIQFTLDLEEEFGNTETEWIKTVRIREKQNAGMQFSLARNGKLFSSVTIVSGSNRNRKEKKIHLTTHQGLFLYNLPFPDGQYLTIEEISDKASIPNENMNEIIDIINELIQLNMIDFL